MRAGWAATWVLAFSGWLVTPREVVTHSGTHPDEQPQVHGRAGGYSVSGSECAYPQLQFCQPLSAGLQLG